MELEDIMKRTLISAGYNSVHLHSNFVLWRWCFQNNTSLTEENIENDTIMYITKFCKCLISDFKNVLRRFYFVIDCQTSTTPMEKPNRVYLRE